jgi:hypothetical protein
MHDAVRKRRKKRLAGLVALLMLVSAVSLAVAFPRAGATAATSTVHSQIYIASDTGDNGLTMWADTNPDQNDVFKFNTVQNPFLADNSAIYGGKNNSITTTQIDTRGVSNPAPQAVWQPCRWNSAFTYITPGLTPGTSSTVQLDWAELTWQAAGKREFNVATKGSQVLSNFDVYAAGGHKRALVKQFTATANSNGQIVITFSQGAADNPFASGIEVYIS